MRLPVRYVSLAALLLVPLVLGPTASAQAGLEAAAVRGAVGQAPLHRIAGALADRYIVTVKKGTDPDTVLRTVGVTPQFVYRTALNGFAARLDEQQLRRVRAQAAVEAVETDAAAGAPRSAVPSAGGSARRAAAGTWGLDRIDQTALPLDGQFNTTHTGTGVSVYIVSSGIDFAHSEFGGRAVRGFDAMEDGGDGQDCQGTGTAIAASVGGANYGVATQAKLVSVRVTGCDNVGTDAGVIAGLDWVAKNAVKPAVVDISISSPKSAALNAAAEAVSAAGLLPVVDAGHKALGSADACDFSPASAARVVVVGASASNDDVSEVSKLGECLTFFAPGKDIVTAKLNGGTLTATSSAFSAAFTAGVAALYLETTPAATPEDLVAWLDDNTTKGVIQGLGTNELAPDNLLYTGGL
ncbi:S8 family peptidase [Streptomyces sp. NPDC058579]|uniref:S8 family peptidase n=1 Tax=Streptomyces sp. NPDC058579 TaxID=3346548 RepID=UPI00364F78AF